MAAAAAQAWAVGTEGGHRIFRVLACRRRYCACVPANASGASAGQDVGPLDGFPAGRGKSLTPSSSVNPVL